MRAKNRAVPDFLKSQKSSAFLTCFLAVCAGIGFCLKHSDIGIQKPKVIQDPTSSIQSNANQKNFENLGNNQQLPQQGNPEVSTSADNGQNPVVSQKVKTTADVKQHLEKHKRKAPEFDLDSQSNPKAEREIDKLALSIISAADEGIAADEADYLRGRTPSTIEILGISQKQYREIVRKENILNYKLAQADSRGAAGNRRQLLTEYRAWLREFLGNDKYDRYRELARVSKM